MRAEGGKRRAKEVGAWKREHAINATADTLARARAAINPYKDAFACGNIRSRRTRNFRIRARASTYSRLC